MTRNWNDIQWIFEADGSLRDIYVQDISLQEWEKLIDHLNDNFNLTYSDNDKIDKKYVLRYLQDTSGEMESKSLTINLGQIKVNCYFFISEQIEFDIDPKDVNSLNDFEKIEKFMTSISEALQEQVTLTAANNPEFPLFKIDTKNEINKILTEKEASEISRTTNSTSYQISTLRTRLQRKFFPRQFEKKLLDRANQEYRPTKKKNNLW
ncbi:hypothetical protein [Prolixibacter sp. NT017]|uniref:hypothetical protein n=1 Tax=Prolixibacter sp. NT017 TaxID=2652390 RepID=UPI001277A6E4|nr:hypothetical protein [Prolixibacter sp. NT017]GET25995.1 hypothetical protein NT017_23240 [Prolixibacter sp. NT017]